MNNKSSAQNTAPHIIGIVTKLRCKIVSKWEIPRFESTGNKGIRFRKKLSPLLAKYSQTESGEILEAHTTMNLRN